MRKISLLIFILLLFGVNNSFSAWYGDFTQTAPTPGLTNLFPNGKGTLCNTDGDTTGGSPTFNKTPLAGTYTYDSKVISINGNIMHCKRWDGAAPSQLAISYISGWTNTSKTVSVYAKDLGGSKLKKIVLQESKNGGVFYNVSTWDNLNSSARVAKTFNRTVVSGNNYKYKIIAYDYAGNSSTTSTTALIKFDTTAPSPADITNNTPVNLLAKASQNFSVTVGANLGSPINLIEGYFEDFNTLNSYLSTKYSSNNGILTITKNIKNVDLNRLANGSRQYSFKITKVCDEAGNCWTGNDVHNYNVYANTTLAITSSITTDLNSINTADGTPHPLTITLKDIYGNQIVPATGINRTIDLTFNVNNTTNLDQRRNTGDAVYLTIPNDNTYTNKLTNTATFSSQPSTNGIYPFNFKVYTPTYKAGATDGRQYANGNFKINNITAKINGSLGSVNSVNINNSTIDFQFKPLYTTKITGPLRDYGFIEGATQTGTINITKNNNSINTTSNNLYLEFGSGTSAPSTSFDMIYYKPSGQTGTLINSLTSVSTNLNQNYNLKTLLTQKVLLSNLSSSYLSTHIGYNIDGKTVIYNQDILGKTNYTDAGGTNLNNITQVGLKVLGKTLSDNQTNITQGQAKDNFNILGNISQAMLRRDIVRTTYNIVKNAPISNGSKIIDDLSTQKWNNAAGKKLQNDKILYFGNLNGGNVTLEISSSIQNPTDLIGKKTIVVKGGNLYIKSNIVNKTNNDILGIIVIKDESGKGGNVYIDPSVGEIDAIIYADKSVISYDGTKELDGTTSQALLRNQLYIYGSIFSNNTIGGSRAIPIVCPYYITGLCDSIKAQTYDFNFLRRYFLYDTTGDGIGDTPANNGTAVFPSTDPNYKYPIVIKYNPMIQLSPPPLFSK